MNKGKLYRVCLKSGTLDDIPTFRVKIGKAQKKINPYFIPSDKQRYNCDSILQRHNQQPHLTLSVFYAYKFVGSGSINFDKKEMPNERVQIFNRDKQSIAFIDCSLIQIHKVVQVPALDITVKKILIEDLQPAKMTGKPFLVLKYGQMNYQTEKQPVFNEDTHEYWFQQAFKFPQSEMQRIIIESWCQIQGNNRFLGVSLIYLHDKQDINRQTDFDVSYMNKKRGQLTLGLAQDKQKAAKVIDYSQAPKRTIKTTVIQAIMLDPIKQGTFIRLYVGKEIYETTPLFVQKKQLNWNQAFTMQVNCEKEELTAELCLKQKKIGRAFLQISKVGNRTYELTLLDEEELDIGKIYLQFYDHELYRKQKKKIPKELAQKIFADLKLIKHRYNQTKPLHQYMQGLLAVVEEGLMMVSKQPNQDPATQLGLFLVNYQKP